jgi:hypothetical protein
MQDQLTVSFSVLPSCAQHSRHHHRRTPNTSSSPSRRRRRSCRSWGIFGFKSFWAKRWLWRLRLRRGGGGVHVRALMKGVGSMKRYRKEGSERRVRGYAGFANKANTPGPQRAAPLPPPPPPPLPTPPWNSGRREGRRRREEGEGREGGGG